MCYNITAVIHYAVEMFVMKCISKDKFHTKKAIDYCRSNTVIAKNIGTLGKYDQRRL